MAGETPAIGLPLFECLRRSCPYFGCSTERKSTWVQQRRSYEPSKVAAAGRIDNHLDTTASILLRFAYPFGIEAQVSIERPGKLRLDVSVVRHVEQDSHRCLEIAASFAAFSR